MEVKLTDEQLEQLREMLGQWVDEGFVDLDRSHYEPQKEILDIFGVSPKPSWEQN